MTGKVRVGVIGVGSLGEHHARIYAGLPSAQLAGIYDVNPARAGEIAGKYNTTAFQSIDELAAAVDAVSVVVPTNHHFEVFSGLANRGIHMLMEKPIAASTAQAEKMVSIAQEKQIILQVGHIERFNPVMKFLEENLARPRFIEVARLGPYPAPGPDGRPRGTDVSVVLDLMIHDLEIIMHIVRSPLKDVHAIGVPVLSATEDIANVRLNFENGCVANVTASRVSQEKTRKIRVFQSDTYVSLDYMNQKGQICRKGPAGIQVEAVPIDRREPLLLELESFVNCVERHAEPVVTALHGSSALKLAARICEQIRNSPS
jgi:predicted dehydrogenase